MDRRRVVGRVQAVVSLDHEHDSALGGRADRPAGAQGIGIGAAAICFFLIAIPFCTLASFEPNGIHRPVGRAGMFRIALPVGVLIGLVTGIASGWWLRRGGTWTANDGSDRYCNR